MIENPKHGWCSFQLGDFVGTASYLTDVPVDLLDVFINYYTNGYGVAVFDQEGSYFTLVLTQYNWGIYIIEELNEAILYDFSNDRNISVESLAKELINDIESDLTSWSVEFVINDDQEEITQHRNEIRQRIVKLKKLMSNKI